MTAHKGIVLDANILLRAALGTRVRHLLRAFEDSVRFYAPDVCFEEARQYLPGIVERRGGAPEPALSVLVEIGRLVEAVDRTLYGDLATKARERVEVRDPKDWPVVAVALLLGVPIWTEDQDFFGTGIPTWTTDRVELYLRE